MKKLLLFLVQACVGILSFFTVILTITNEWSPLGDKFLQQSANTGWILVLIAMISGISYMVIEGTEDKLTN
jgi:hypothetical protein